MRATAAGRCFSTTRRSNSSGAAMTHLGSFEPSGRWGDEERWRRGGVLRVGGDGDGERLV